jgi:preprotein translocase subunit SecA
MSMDDELLLAGFGPRKAKRLREMGEAATGELSGMRRTFFKAQAKVERRNFRGRKMLLYHEKQRRKMQMEMGQDPYLDTPE